MSASVSDAIGNSFLVAIGMARCRKIRGGSPADGKRAKSRIGRTRQGPRRGSLRADPGHQDAARHEHDKRGSVREGPLAWARGVALHAHGHPVRVPAGAYPARPAELRIHRRDRHW